MIMTNNEHSFAGGTFNDNICEIHRQQLELPTTLSGKITRIGYYQDTLPKLIITVKKEQFVAIPIREGERLPVPFIINGQRFIAGVRTTNRSATVMICPDLNDADQGTFRLADLLYCNGWDMKNSRLDLVINDGVINCF
jgi:hypothetical protein